MQRQLAVTRHGLVELRPYLTELCASIGASMIRDHKKVSLDVDVDGSSVEAEASVSLGLVVTELVINALKHAFPDGRGGTIRVSYHQRGGDWTLSVQDDGAGMARDRKEPKPGLGTGIVEALTAHLGGKLQVTTSHKGTEIEITRNAKNGELTQAA